MRTLLHFLGCAASLFFVIELSAEASAPFDSVAVRYREEADFKHLSEYFTGREATVGRVILRSDSSSRNGVYFMVRLPDGNTASKSYPTGSRFSLKVIAGHSTDILPYSFEIPHDMQAGQRVWIGLTGKDWPAERPHLLAWNLILENPAGIPLLEHRSFAWELEEK